MNTSPFVVVLVSLAAVAALYGFVCEIRLESLAARLRDQVRERHPDIWEGLPWHQRQLLSPRAALKRLVHQGILTDRAFIEGRAELSRLERRMLAAIAAGALAVALVGLGTSLWDWSW